jgi:hypothetical protein
MDKPEGDSQETRELVVNIRASNLQDLLAHYAASGSYNVIAALFPGMTVQACGDLLRGWLQIEQRGDGFVVVSRMSPETRAAFGLSE